MSLSKGCGLALVVVALLFGIIAYGGYSLFVSTKADRHMLESEGAAWILNFNAKRFSACYARTDGSLRAVTSEAVYIEQLAKLFAEHGALTLGRQISLYINTHNGQSTATSQWTASGSHGEVEVVLLFTKNVTWGITGFIVRTPRSKPE